MVIPRVDAGRVAGRGALDSDVRDLAGGGAGRHLVGNDDGDRRSRGDRPDVARDAADGDRRLAAVEHAVAVHVVVDPDVAEAERQRGVRGVEKRREREDIDVVTGVREAVAVVDRLPGDGVLRHRRRRGRGLARVVRQNRQAIDGKHDRGDLVRGRGVGVARKILEPGRSLVPDRRAGGRLRHGRGREAEHGREQGDAQQGTRVEHVRPHSFVRLMGTT